MSQFFKKAGAKKGPAPPVARRANADSDSESASDTPVRTQPAARGKPRQPQKKAASASHDSGSGSGSASETESDATSSESDDSEDSSESGSDSESGDSDGSNRLFATQKKPAAHKVVRRRQAASDSESESESESESDSDSDDSAPPVKRQVPVKKPAPTVLLRDKRLDDMRNYVRVMTNAKKINDWVAINNEFDRLTNAFSRLSSIIVPDERNPTPFRFYHRCLSSLEELQKNTLDNAAVFAKMNAANSKAFTATKQKLKKVFKNLENEIKAFRENPVNEQESETEAIELAKKIAASAPTATAAAADSESEDSLFDNESSDSSESESEDEEANKLLSARERMLKKFGRTPPKPKTGGADAQADESDSDDDGAKRKADKTKKKSKAEKTIIKKDAVRAAAAAAAAASSDGTAPAAPTTAGDGFTPIGKSGKVVEVTPDNLYKRLKELVLARGKKSTDKVAQIEQLTRLLEIAVTPHMKAQVLLVLIPSLFDYNPLSSGGFLPTEYWKSTRTNIDTLLDILDENHTIKVSENIEGDEIDPADNENNFKDGKLINLRGNIYSFVDRLSEEFIKSLQHIDPHTTEYIERLKDETPLYVLIVRAQRYFERVKSKESSDSCILKRVLHVYYKTDNVIAFMESAIPAATRKEESTAPGNLVHVLCTKLYETSDIRVRARALLAHVYHLALHGQFYEARDMLLMSHLQEQVQNTDVETQILYNRTVVQLGMSAFRKGLVRESANALQDFFGSGKTKELLAQGFQASNRFAGGGAAGAAEKTPEQERLEKQRLLPFHMHINLELLECIYLTCSMLLEIPNMAMYAHDSRRKIISKPFRRNLDYNQKQVFIGPPENTRDHIMAAAKALSSGEWEKCRDFIHAIKIWSLMPDSAAIKEMLTTKIQEEGLRTYIFQFAPYYDSLGLGQLGRMFSLAVGRVHTIVAKMIVNEELCASLDEPSETVVLHRNAPGVEMSRLEHLAGVYADKVATLVDANEKMLESRSIVLGQQQQQQQMVMMVAMGGASGGDAVAAGPGVAGMAGVVAG
ncbi:Translation initiation factor 3 subunit c, partial [Entophlyctis sp. JEL0112]